MNTRLHETFWIPVIYIGWMLKMLSYTAYFLPCKVLVLCLWLTFNPQVHMSLCLLSVLTWERLLTSLVFHWKSRQAAMWPTTMNLTYIATTCIGWRWKWSRENAPVTVMFLHVAYWVCRSVCVRWGNVTPACVLTSDWVNVKMLPYISLTTIKLPRLCHM